MFKGKILRAASLIGIINAVAIIMGFVVQAVIAHAYGVSKEMDAFQMALLIPASIVTVLTANATVLLIPRFSRDIVNNDLKSEGDTLGSVIKGASLFLVVVIVVALFYAEYILKLVAPGFTPEALALTRQIFYIIMPAAIFLTITGILGVSLQAHYKFGPTALSPFFYKVLAIVLVGFFASKIGIRALGISYGLASVMSAFFLLKMSPHRLKALLSAPLRHPVWGAILPAVVGPLLVFRILDQVNHIVPRGFASTFPEGSVAALGYAWTLIAMPMSILMTSLSTAVFPAYSQLIAENKKGEIGETIAFGIRTVFLISVPLTVGLIFLGKSAIYLIFQHGAFDAQATHRVYEFLVIYALGICGFGWNSVLGYYFWAKSSYRILLITASIGVLTNLGCLWVLKDIIGIWAIPTGMSACYLVQSIVFFLFQHKSYSVNTPNICAALCRIGLAGLGMAFIMFIINTYAMPNITAVLQILVNGVMGCAVFIIILLLAKGEEASDIRNLFDKAKNFFNKKHGKEV